MKVWDFLPKIPPKTQPSIYFVTAWQYWLGIVKPKIGWLAELDIG